MTLPRRGSFLSPLTIWSLAIFLLAVSVTAYCVYFAKSAQQDKTEFPVASLQPRPFFDTSALPEISRTAEQWHSETSLEEIAHHWDGAADRTIATIDQYLNQPRLSPADKSELLWTKAVVLLSDGKPEKAYAIFQDTRARAEEAGGALQSRTLAGAIYFMGLASLRRGENDNCILCRGESSCILPISPSAIHKNTEGSRQAIKHFSEYLQHFPDDLEVKWLLNVAHMTLGEYPSQVDPQYLINLDHFFKSEFDIGRFRDIGHIVGVNRFNQAGGAIMEDFDNDGLLDLVVSSMDPLQSLGFYRNSGGNQFDDYSQKSGIEGQLGGLSCVQTDYNNDGLMDVYIPRGAWLHRPICPSLLKNDGNLHFTDVTQEVGLLDPVNSNSGMWADFDNDGWLDLFVACEQQPSRLYRNRAGTFIDVTEKSGLNFKHYTFTKGCAWIDYDNDDYPDLFVNHLRGGGQLFHNNRDGTFSDTTTQMGIDGSEKGFSCWAFDYDNDGWMDLFATCYVKSLADAVRSLMGEPHLQTSNKLYRNIEGRKFEDVSFAAGLDAIVLTMGSNFGDFDNDGYLDMYLGTGEPRFDALVPNRMYKNVKGKRFADITASAGVGHLQKGHGIACGDWDRDGNVDIFIEMGGAINGDKYHNILFQNPGHDHHWIAVKLVGSRTNRAAMGARIKIVTAGEQPLTVYRHVSSGSSFGSSPLEQTIGIGRADHIAELEIHWPTSNTTQVFRDLAVDQCVSVTEFSDRYQKIEFKRKK